MRSSLFFLHALALAALAACTSLTGAADLTVLQSDPNSPPPPVRSAMPDGPSVPDAGADDDDDPGKEISPSAFTLEAVTNATPDTSYTATAQIKFTGTSLLSASVASGDASSGIANDTTKSGFFEAITVANGDVIAVKAKSSATPGASKSIVVKVGARSVTWKITTAAACPAQDVTWGDATTSCTANSGAVLAPDAHVTVNDTTTDPASGIATFTCTNGALVASAPVCGKPKVFALAKDCGTGYCTATTAPSCTPDPALADAFCVFKGYTVHTGTPGTKTTEMSDAQCAPNGSRCSTPDNPACQVVFSSITCRY